MISPQNDEEFGQFGYSALSLLDMLLPDKYHKIVIINPTFSDTHRANVLPQFSGGDFFVLSSVEGPPSAVQICGNLNLFAASEETESLLEQYRYEHVIFASSDLSILTAWAQSEYALVAFKCGTLDEHRQWLEAMQAIGVVREVAQPR